MKLKIISDGHTMNTKVINQETGEVLSGVQSIKFEIESKNPYAVVEIKIFNYNLEIDEEFINKKVLVMK